MNRDQILEAVIKIVHAEANQDEDVPEIEVTKDTKPSETMDSLSLVSLAMEIEKKTGNEAIYGIPLDFLRELTIDQLVSACLGEPLSGNRFDESEGGAFKMLLYKGDDTFKVETFDPVDFGEHFFKHLTGGYNIPWYFAKEGERYPVVAVLQAAR